MLTTIEAIVLHLSKYTDKASILHVYTRQYGRVAYMVYGIQGKKGKILQSYLQPFSHIEITAHQQPNRQIQQLKDVRLLTQYAAVDIRVHTISLFLSEILYRTLLHPMADDDLFQWLIEEKTALDNTSDANFHILFLLHLSVYLGISFPLDEQGNFDMHTAEYTLYKPLHTDYFSAEDISQLQAIENKENITLTRKQRQSLLEKLCRYYELHLTDFQTPKSLAILEEMFDDI